MRGKVHLASAVFVQIPDDNPLPTAVVVVVIVKIIIINININHHYNQVTACQQVSSIKSMGFM